MKMKEFLEIGASMASIIFVVNTISQWVPNWLTERIELWLERLSKYFFPSGTIIFEEFNTSGFGNRNKDYIAIEYYLSSKSAARVTRLKAERLKRKSPLVFSSDDYESIEDEFEGVKVRWQKGKHHSEKKVIYTGLAPNDKNYYALHFDPRDWKIVTELYLERVWQKGKEIKKESRQRRLYTNCEDDGSWDYKWLEHPASFDTFAIDPEKKEEIMNDLIAFSQGKEYYSKIGKAWKRGYLLYGPPGTGKSTMILAMAKLLGYDIYDLELTTVKDNGMLKRLLINSSSKGIFVVEDIDCSLDITGKRDNLDSDSDSDDENTRKKKRKSKVTLSGFLNFVDGIWSGCGGERIIVFTTNHLDRLDPALIRKGRMDVHIELSYCTFGGFKVLARNYLDLESHYLFERIRNLLEEVNMTPAEVSEHLIHGRVASDATICLESLINALESAKEQAVKGEEDEESSTNALESAMEQTDEGEEDQESSINTLESDMEQTVEGEEDQEQNSN